MRRWMSPARYHWLVLLMVLALCALVLAWVSFGLLNMAMANAAFLRAYGLMAVMEGGLVQLVQIAAQALVAMLAYLGFKGIETELIHRWRGDRT